MFVVNASDKKYNWSLSHRKYGRGYKILKADGAAWWNIANEAE